MAQSPYLDINGTLWLGKGFLVLLTRDFHANDSIIRTTLYTSELVSVGSTKVKDPAELSEFKKTHKYVGTLTDLDLESFVESVKSNEI